MRDRPEGRQAKTETQRDQVSFRQAEGWRDGKKREGRQTERERMHSHLSEQQADRLLNRETDNLRVRHTESGNKKAGRQCHNR